MENDKQEQNIPKEKEEETKEMGFCIWCHEKMTTDHPKKCSWKI